MYGVLSTTSSPSISSESYSTLRIMPALPRMMYMPIFMSYLGPPSSPPRSVAPLIFGSGCISRKYACVLSAVWLGLRLGLGLG